VTSNKFRFTGCEFQV